MDMQSAARERFQQSYIRGVGGMVPPLSGGSCHLYVVGDLCSGGPFSDSRGSAEDAAIAAVHAEIDG